LNRHRQLNLYITSSLTKRSEAFDRHRRSNGPPPLQIRRAWELLPTPYRSSFPQGADESEGNIGSPSPVSQRKHFIDYYSTFQVICIVSYQPIIYSAPTLRPGSGQALEQRPQVGSGMAESSLVAGQCPESVDGPATRKRHYCATGRDDLPHSDNPPPDFTNFPSPFHKISIMLCYTASRQIRDCKLDIKGGFNR
jgi:hypothetical protein